MDVVDSTNEMNQPAAGIRASVAVAKYSPRDGGLQIAYLAGDDAVTLATLEGLDSPLVAGSYRVDLVVGNRRRELELTISPRGKVFDLAASGLDGVTARGMGITDPEFPDCLLVSWWWSKWRPAGIVKYMLGDAPDQIVATYTSVMLEATGFDDVLGGLATGPTGDGIPGSYTITYEGEAGTSFGPFEWSITPRGRVLDLTWDVAGARVIDGFGFADPESDRSIIVVYWGAGQGA
jgi:hypothetical protein